MKASPQGASVVPSAAAIAIQPSGLVGRCGTSEWCHTCCQSGPARMPSTMYRARVAEMTSSTRSTRWNEPSTTTSEISTAAIGVLTHEGIPTSEPAA